MPNQKARALGKVMAKGDYDVNPHTEDLREKSVGVS
jgi:hypothetical protein